MIPSQIDDEIHRASRTPKLRNAKLTTLLLAMYRNHQNSAKLQNFQLCQLIFLFVPLKMEKPNRRRQKKKKKKRIILHIGESPGEIIQAYQQCRSI